MQKLVMMDLLDYGVRLEQLLECFYAETGITCDAAHRKCVDRIVARNSNDANSIGHDGVLTLTRDMEACLL